MNGEVQGSFYVDMFVDRGVLGCEFKVVEQLFDSTNALQPRLNSLNTHLRHRHLLIKLFEIVERKLLFLENLCHLGLLLFNSTIFEIKL